MKTYREIYLTGRKHCSRCKRWKHVIDFQVRHWANEPFCTIPRTLSSVCTVCTAAKRREKTGYKLNQWYKHGLPGSKKFIEHRNRLNRAAAKRRRRNPEYRKLESEYGRIWREAKGQTNGSRLRKPELGPDKNILRAPF